MMDTDEADFIIQNRETVQHHGRDCRVTDMDLPLLRVVYDDDATTEWVESVDIERTVCLRCWGTQEIETQTRDGFILWPCPDCRWEDV